MARPKEFDPNSALEKALAVFWGHGYEATSMRNLEQAMGIGKQSLYDTFGDTHQLFLAALDRYIQQNRDKLQEDLGAEGPALPALKKYFEDICVFLTPAAERPACLVTNTILEMGNSDPEVSQVCRENQRAVTCGFREILQRAVENRELDEIEDLQEMALFLIAQVYGMAVLAKNGASRRSLRQMASRALSVLDVS